MSDIQKYAQSFLGGALMGLAAILFLLLIKGRFGGIGAGVKGVPKRADVLVYLGFAGGSVVSLVIYRVLSD
jgi:hypothetical protein